MPTSLLNVVFAFLLTALLEQSCAGADISRGDVEAVMEGVDLQVAVSDFHDWFRSNYGSSRPILTELAAAEGGLRLGVFATADIPAEAVYLSIPEKMCMFDDTIFATPTIGPAIQRLLHRTGNRLQPQQLALNLFLTHQRFVAQNTSFFHPYIQLLPSAHDIPEYYSIPQLELLNGTLIPRKAKQLRQRHLSDFNFLTNLWASDATLRKDFPARIFSRNRYLWAQSILNTRMIWWNGAPHLVPMLDMINCKQGATNPYRVHSTAIGTTPGRADTKAPWPFRKGDQIFENYGQPNPTYFLYHGFVMNPNVHDCAQVELLAARWESLSSSHRTALERLGLHKREFCVTSEERTLSEPLTLARVLVASPSDASALRRPPHSILSRLNEGKALTLMKRSLLMQLENFLSDEALSNAFEAEGVGLATKEMEFRKAMITAFVVSQKNIIKETVNAVERRITPLRRKRSLLNGSPDEL